MGSKLNEIDYISIYRRADDPKVGCYVLTPKLMTGSDLTDQESEFVQGLDGLIEAVKPHNEERILYRGCSLACFGAIESGEPYPAFLSTSSIRDEALFFAKKEKGVLLKINAPVGLKALPVSPQQDNLSTLEANEFLLGRGHRFQILGKLEPAVVDDNNITLGSLFASDIQEFEVRFIPH